MTPEQAEWVRANAWTRAMRKTFKDTPGHYLTCDCQYTGGPCSPNPGEPRHDICHIGVPLPSCETYICTKGGGVAGFREPYKHPSVSATGWHHVTTAMVWLADRTCRWACPCDCGHPGPTPTHALQPEPPADLIPAPRVYKVVEVGTLFDFAEVTA